MIPPEDPWLAHDVAGNDDLGLASGGVNHHQAVVHVSVTDTQSIKETIKTVNIPCNSSQKDITAVNTGYNSSQYRIYNSSQYRI